MAYAYSAIDDLLNEEQQKQNIFSAEPGQQPPQPGQTQSQGQVKTSTEGEVGPSYGGSGSSTGGEAAKPQEGDTGQADRAAVKANVGKTSQPKVFSDIQNQIKARESTLQDEANKYVAAGKANQQYGVSQDEMEKAIGGDQPSAQKTRELLTRQNINTVEDFKPSDVEVRDTSLLNTDAGLRELVGRGQGPQYTQGMSAFDLRSLRKTPGFDNLIKLIQGEQTGVRGKAADYQTSKKQEVTDYGKAALAGAQQASKGYLGGQSSAIDDLNAREAAEYNARLAQYRSQGVPEAEARALADNRRLVEQEYQQMDPRYARFVAQASADPRAALNVRADAGRDDFVNAQEAQRFNAIMGLLGQGDARTQSAALGPDYTFNDDLIRQQLKGSTQGLRAAEDVQQRQRIDALMAEAQRRADEDDARRAALNFDQIRNDQAAAARAGLDQGLMGYYQEGLVDPNQYFSRDTRDLNAQDVISADEARRLNEIYGDLGSQQRIQAGNQALGGAGYSFDRGAYENALKTILGDRKATDEQNKAIAAAQAEAERQQRERDYLNKTMRVNVPGLGSTPIGITQGQGNQISDFWKRESSDPLNYATGGMIAPAKVLAPNAVEELRKRFPSTPAPVSVGGGGGGVSVGGKRYL